MDLQTYEAISEVIKNRQGLPRDCLQTLRKQFSSVPYDTLYSILSLEYQRYRKINHVKFHFQKNRYWNLYNKTLLENNNKAGSLLKIAKECDIEPCLLAELILQKYFEVNSNKYQDCPTNVKVFLKDTSLIGDKDLAYDVFLCTLYDNTCSPLSDVMKTSIGQQYEIKLNNELKKLGVTFLDEEDLRKNGFDKTPDVKLVIPVAIDGFIVNWIESKARFGDEEDHRSCMSIQYLSYWNRFGSGLIIYWFGFLEIIVEPGDKRFMIRDHLPTNITHMTSLVAP